MLDVKVTISVSQPIGGVGFGVPLLVEGGVTTSPVGYTECYNLTDVIAAGFEATTAMYKAANVVFSQTNRPEKIAVCQSAGSLVEALTAVVSRGWRQAVVVNGNIEEYVAAADYIETTKDKMLFLSMSREDFATLEESLANKKYDRTVFFVNETENAAAALVGETAGRDAGSFTYKFKNLKGVVAEEFTDVEINTLHKSGAFGYVTKAGTDITTEGISQSGKYLDITDSIDFVIQNIEYKVQQVFNNTPKVSFDDRGIALIESATVSALQDAFNNGIIAVQADGVTPDYTVSFAPRSATSEADRASRVYKYGSFAFSLAGSIHEAHIEGTVTY